MYWRETHHPTSNVGRQRCECRPGLRVYDQHAQEHAQSNGFAGRAKLALRPGQPLNAAAQRHRQPALPGCGTRAGCGFHRPRLPRLPRLGASAIRWLGGSGGVNFGEVATNIVCDGACFAQSNFSNTEELLLHDLWAHRELGSITGGRSSRWFRPVPARW